MWEGQSRSAAATICLTSTPDGSSAIALVIRHLSKRSLGLSVAGSDATATEVAEMLHLHVNTVKRLGDRGELPFYRVCKRGDRRFRLEDVMRFLAKNR